MRGTPVVSVSDTQGDSPSVNIWHITLNDMIKFLKGWLCLARCNLLKASSYPSNTEWPLYSLDSKFWKLHIMVGLLWLHASLCWSHTAQVSYNVVFDFRTIYLCKAFFPNVSMVMVCCHFKTIYHITFL